MMIETYSFPHIVLGLGILEFILGRAIEDAYGLLLMGSVHKVTFNEKEERLRTILKTV